MRSRRLASRASRLGLTVLWVAALSSCHCGGHRPPVVPAAVRARIDDQRVAMSQEKIARPYPNARVRLRIARATPTLPDREGYVEIRMRGSRFRIDDATERSLEEILEDVAVEHGLGGAPRTMEGIMDLWSQSSRAADAAERPVTTLYGDLATGQGQVQSPDGRRWAVAAARLVPVVEQVLAPGLEARLGAARETTRLGRRCAEQHGIFDGEEGGLRWHVEVTRAVAPPFLLLEDTRNTEDSEHRYTREVVAIEEGVVTEAEVQAPPL